MRIPDKVYDVMKVVLMIAAPLAAFIIEVYTAITTGSFPDIVNAVLLGLSTLCGTILTRSSKEYWAEQEAANG